jgi:cell wall-associated NlpC family hydrolase
LQVNALRRLIGIPFVDKGRDLSGMDCAGLAKETMRVFGHEVDDVSVSCFDAVAVNAVYERAMLEGKWRKVEIPEPGDMGVMRLDPMCPNMVSHVGVYIGEGRMLHTLKKRESHVVRTDDPYWSVQIRAWYRWAG